MGNSPIPLQYLVIFNLNTEILILIHAVIFKIIEPL